jgi:hypothetical protein
VCVISLEPPLFVLFAISLEPPLFVLFVIPLEPPLFVLFAPSLETTPFISQWITPPLALPDPQTCCETPG